MNEQSPEPSQAARRLIRHSRAIALAIGFFTRLPTWYLKDITDDDMGRVLMYFPLVGLAVGLVSVVTGLLLYGFLSHWHGDVMLLHQVLLGVLVFTVMTLITGGLHLDGLADCADAWIGGLGSKERTLEIMKDPVSGPMAVFILILVLLLKTAAVVVLVASSAWLILLLIPVLSRTAGMAMFITTDYVRPKGLGKAFASFGTRLESKVAMVVGLTIPVVIVGDVLMFALLVTAGFWWWLRKESLARLDGFTGDVAGAMIELSEMSLLVVAALLCSPVI